MDSQEQTDLTNQAEQVLKIDDTKENDTTNKDNNTFSEQSTKSSTTNEQQSSNLVNQENLINLTIKTPKDKESVSLSKDSNVEQVNLKV